MDAGSYEEAIAAFEALDDYQDITAKIAMCEAEIKYVDAVALMNAGQYEEAIAVFEELADHKDSTAKKEECEAAILERKYDQAIAALDAGNYIQAYDSLTALDGYKDSAEQAAAIYDKYNAAKLQQANEGDYVFFGKYEQDGNTSNGTEAIEWIVLSKDESKILVLSKYALELLPYHTSNESVTWGTCSLREWLNNDFIDSAFSSSEEEMIATVTVPAHKNPAPRPPNNACAYRKSPSKAYRRRKRRSYRRHIS
jgi:tetratricopeptide (TPR) repeat protein